MDDLLRRGERLRAGESQAETVEALLRGQRAGEPGLGLCPVCEGRQVLMREFDDPEDCPACFGSGCWLTRAHLDLAAFAGKEELRGLLLHSDGDTPCWCGSEVRELGEFLLAVRKGWGVLPGVVALCAAIGPHEPPATVRIDPTSMRFVDEAFEWIEEGIDLLEPIFGPSDWIPPFDLLDLTWVDSVEAEETRSLLEPARTAVAAWGSQALAPLEQPLASTPLQKRARSWLVQIDPEGMTGESPIPF